ncbi:hypothetical protein HDA40_003960 [Hamadaea flava]|uniref:PknH-like extracellular domain-containing protein n=1 Tax=Hamadaea flava TaxID=1742688 RepID=A0ABV8LHY6_9ACTN|nr:hypothetical protein [Hamadaea flava]MCP2325453.1 hypothetical protein [Hamadaea flava]
MASRTLVIAVLVLAATAGCQPRTTGTSAPAVSAGSAHAADLLTRRDIPGAGWRPVGVPADLGWSFAVSGCPVYAAADYPAQRHRAAARAAAFSQGHGREVRLILEGYADSWADQAMTDVRKVIAACPRYDDGEVLASHTIEAEGFAGDDSLMVRSDHVKGAEPAKEWWTAVVRRGSTVATVTGTQLTESEVRRIALAQVDRL